MEILADQLREIPLGGDRVRPQHRTLLVAVAMDVRGMRLSTRRLKLITVTRSFPIHMVQLITRMIDVPFRTSQGENLWLRSGADKYNNDKRFPAPTTEPSWTYQEGAKQIRIVAPLLTTR